MSLENDVLLRLITVLCSVKKNARPSKQSSKTLPAFFEPSHELVAFGGSSACLTTVRKKGVRCINGAEQCRRQADDWITLGKWAEAHGMTEQKEVP